MTNKELAKAMINYRAAHDMSIKALANKARVSIQTVRNLEKGIASPTRLTRAKIKRAIDIAKYWED